MFPTHQPLGPVDYTKPVVPSRYQCTDCHVTGVRLWRRYEFPYCVKCAEINERVSPEEVDEHGIQIGRMLAALPTEDGEAYLGYPEYREHLESSDKTPLPALTWWMSLPARST